jgi:hypothetical protein
VANNDEILELLPMYLQTWEEEEKEEEEEEEERQ